LTQTWRVTLPWFADRIWLPRAAPIQSGSVTVTYYDAAETLQTLEASRYRIYEDAEPASIALAPNGQWPTTIERADAVQITYDCGWSDADDVPAPLRHAILLLASHWYLQREAASAAPMTDVPFSVDALCGPFIVAPREFEMVA
jgi:uncharacterized phiE125 gp8 family phage protein